MVRISIKPSRPLGDLVNFVMPRSIPGGYGINKYDDYIEHLYAFGNNGDKFVMIKDENGAPRWSCSNAGKQIVRLEYEVNLNKMERNELPGDASIIRSRFSGILNYSVFGWIDGKEAEPVQCIVQTFSSWPIFSTIRPSDTLTKGSMKFSADNYYTLADGQTFIGPRFRVREFKGVVPIFVASYCQTADEYLDDYGEQEIISMGILENYFGDLPFPYYSLMLRRAIPLEDVGAPSLAMEHLKSSTFFGDTSGMRTLPMDKKQILRTLPTYLHHMGHAFIPLRCYGDTYRPYVEEIPPIINNIWFNEGFMWFLPYDTLKSERWKEIFNDGVYHTSPIIKKMSLCQLSQTSSTMYGTDFRLGLATFSRGAMMAIEMDKYLKAVSGGRKSMKDVLRYLYQWSVKNKRPFTMEEFPSLLDAACGIDLHVIYEKWQLPIE